MFSILPRLLHLLPPETAHEATLLALKTGLAPCASGEDDAVLRSQLWGLDLPNPVGLSGGFDKNAVVVVPLLKLGFGFVEAGTVTPRPQGGNPKPRLFRVPSCRAVINRMGMNNEGLGPYLERFRVMANNPVRKKGVVGANVGRNKDSTDGIADYVTGVKAVSAYADYVVINISSPNTPGLRASQQKSELTALLSALQEARSGLPKKPPLVVKIAPDLDDQALSDVAEVVMAANVDGLTVGNTTVSRPPGIPPEFARETGGLSGPPLFEMSNEVLRKMYRLTGGKIPLIGVGGIASGEDAYKKIRLGASLVQLYTGLIYGGPQLLFDIKKDLAALLRRDGFKNVQEAVGTLNL